jgi:hypothetical protein
MGYDRREGPGDRQPGSVAGPDLGVPGRPPLLTRPPQPNLKRKMMCYQNRILGLAKADARFRAHGRPRARARARRVVPISELVFGALTQNRSSLEPSLGFAAIARHAALWIMHDTVQAPLKSRCGTPKGCGASSQCCAGHASRQQNRPQRYRRSQCAACRLSRQIQETAQDYPGFGLKLQTPTPKSAQLTSLAPAGCRLACRSRDAPGG